MSRPRQSKSLGFLRQGILAPGRLAKEPGLPALYEVSLLAACPQVFSSSWKYSFYLNSVDTRAVLSREFERLWKADIAAAEQNH